MLNVYPIALQIIRALQPVIRDIRRRDRNLADQLDRCSTSVALNIAEGDAHRGAMRRHKHEIALGEMREVMACLDVAEAKQLITRPHTIAKQVDHVIGVLVRVTRHRTGDAAVGSCSNTR